MRRVAFLGATRGIGRALARELAMRGDELYLWGRDLEDLARTASDLAVRSGRAEPFPIAHLDLSRPAGFQPAVAAALETLGGLDLAVITAADFAPQAELEQDPERALELLQVDFSHTVTLCEHLRGPLMAEGGGALCVFSSVAGDRGRKPVVLYGAAKAGLSRYLEGLDHRFHDQGLAVVCVKPGFVHTDMTRGLAPPPFAGTPEGVARDVLRALDSRRPVVYTPWIWRWILLVIRLLPRFVMRRVGF